MNIPEIIREQAGGTNDLPTAARRTIRWGRGVGGGPGRGLWSGSHGQSAGLGGGRLRSLRGTVAALLPHQLVVLKQTLVAAAAVREQQEPCVKQNHG